MGISNLSTIKTWGHITSCCWQGNEGQCMCVVKVRGIVQKVHVNIKIAKCTWNRPQTTTNEATHILGHGCHTHSYCSWKQSMSFSGILLKLFWQRVMTADHRSAGVLIHGYEHYNILVQQYHRRKTYAQAHAYPTWNMYSVFRRTARAFRRINCQTDHWK